MNMQFYHRVGQTVIAQNLRSKKFLLVWDRDPLAPLSSQYILPERFETKDEADDYAQDFKTICERGK